MERRGGVVVVTLILVFYSKLFSRREVEGGIK